MTMCLRGRRPSAIDPISRSSTLTTTVYPTYPNDITENDAAFKTAPTPGDFSQTCVPYRQPRPATVFGQRFGEGETTTHDTAPTLLDFVFRDHRELIHVLLYVWNQGPIPYAHDHLDFGKIDVWRKTMGSAKVLWQELVNFMESHDVELVKRSLEAWPTRWE